MEERTDELPARHDAGDLTAIAETLQDAEAIGADIETTALIPATAKYACSSSPPPKRLSL